MRCKICHYPLQGLTDHRCPECGNTFDPNDPSSLARKDECSVALLIAGIVLAQLTLVVVYVCSYYSYLYPLDPAERYSQQSVMAAMFAAGATIVALILMTLLCLLVFAIRKTMSILRADDPASRR